MTLTQESGIFRWQFSYAKYKPMTSNKTTFIDIDNAREQEQKQVMEDIRDADHCPFCWENLQKYHQQPIIKETKFWRLTKNQWPYRFTKMHLLAIYKEHIVDLAGIDPEAGKELIELFQWVEKEYKVPGGGWAMRFGDTDYSAGTVAHIHAQFLWPDIHHPNYLEKPVRVKIGKTKKA